MGLFSKLFKSKDSIERVSAEEIQIYLNKIFVREKPDPLLAEVIFEVVCAQLGTTSFIQRSFSIGYNRAGRISDQMEIIGIIKKGYDNTPTKVLIKEEELIPHLKDITELSKEYSYLSLVELKEQVSLLMAHKQDGTTVEHNTSPLVDLDENTLSKLGTDEKGFITYPNGVKLKLNQAPLYNSRVIYEIITSLGYNLDELFYTSHSEDGNNVNFENASTFAYWELFSNKLVCIVRSDERRVNYQYINDCQNSAKGHFSNRILFYRLKDRIKDHYISRDFISRVFNVTLSISDNIDKNAIIGALLKHGIKISLIDCVIEKKYTYYDLCPYDNNGTSTLFYEINRYKSELKSDLLISDLILEITNNKTVRVGIPNTSVIVGKYTFTFGGEKTRWLADCLCNGYSMQTLSSFIDNERYYRELIQTGQLDEKVKERINMQAECYEKIDNDILQSKISINKFRYSYDSDQINYIAMAAFYKQCDVSQTVFLDSTYGEYEILSKEFSNGINITKIRAYHETFVFTNGHSLLNQNIDIEERDDSAINDDNSGYIYVMINPSLEGMVKIGKTTRDPNDRVKELSSVTGVPTPFILVYYKQFDNCHYAEKRIHSILEQKGCRVSDNREFFNITPTDAIKIVQMVYDAEQ